MNFPSPLLPHRRPEEVAPGRSAESAERRSEAADLDTIRGALVRRRWTIVAATAAVVVVAGVLTMLWPESYESTATVLVEQSEREGEAAEIPGLAVLERVEQITTLETETELIRSRRVVSDAVDSLDAHVTLKSDGGTYRPSDLLNGFRAGSDARPGAYVLARSNGSYVVRSKSDERELDTAEPGDEMAFAGLSFRLPEAPGFDELAIRVTAFPKAVSAVRKRVSVSPPAEDGQILEIRCEASTARMAQDLCSAITREYVGLRTELHRSSAAHTAAFLKEQVAEYEERLAAAEDTLEAFARENRGVALGEQAIEEVRNYAGVRARRDRMEAEREALSRLLDRADRTSGTRAYRDLASFPSLLQNQAVSQLLTQLAELENRRSDLAQRRSRVNPELAALDERIAAIERQLGQMARSYERSLGSEVASLNRVLGQSGGRLQNLPERQVEMARLERKVSSLGNIHELLQTRLREARIAEAVDRPRVRVVDAASLPLEPAFPKPAMNLVLALVLGLGFGLALAFVREHADTRIHGRTALEGHTDLPILAMIPYVKRSAPVLAAEPLRVDETIRPQVEEGEAGAGLLPALRSPRAENRLGRDRFAGNGREVALEAFRSLGSDLQFLARRVVDGDLRSLAVTSASREDGKTFVACNLALTRAAFGVHTLLVDADMRAGGVARFLDLEASPGLSELLGGETSPRQARRTVLVDDIDTLSVMPSGRPTPHAAELLETSYFDAILADARAVYDLVVIDTPPLNVLPDTAAVIGSVDAAVVVVRDGVTDGSALELTLERLRRAGATVLGVVFNDVNLPGQYSYETYAYHA